MKRSKALNRNRVFHELQTGCEFPLTIVEAPMGFGKTTAVRSFFDAQNRKPQWITFRSADQSASLFWHAFVDAIGGTNDKARAALENVGFPTDAPQLNKFFSILNNLTNQDNFIFVMDDYHLSQNLQLNKLILQIAQEEIAWLHLIIITRDTTNLDFVELLSKGLCYVISQQKLRFTKDEIKEYCRMMTAEITPTDLAKICEYSGGWISFIYIILLGLEQGLPVGISGTIDELIEKALFNSYDRDIQDFLLKLSIMDEFTAAQAEYVTGNENAAAELKDMCRKNAFIFYDEVHKTYKIHNVLLDFLRLKQHFPEWKLKELYGRLGDWYLEKEDFPSAYSFLYRSGQINRILSQLNDQKNMRNNVPSFEGEDELFDSVSKEQLFQFPLAYLQHILQCVILGKRAISIWTQRLNELQQYYEDSEGIDDEYHDRIIGEILVVKIITLFNNAPAISAAFDKVYHYLKGQQSYIALLSNAFTFGSPHYTYLYFREAGSLQKLKDLLSGEVQYAKFSNGCGEGSDLLSLAEYALETGDWDHVELYSTRAMRKAEAKNQTSIIICAKFNLIRFLIFQGKVGKAIHTLEQLEKDNENTNFPVYYSTIAMCKGYLYSCICQPEKIPFWLQTGDMATATLYYQGVGFNYLVYGKALMASSRYAELEVQTEIFQKKFSLYSNQLGFIHNYIFKAVAKYQLYGSDAGTAILEEGLFKAQTDNLIMPFVETATYILKMLKSIAEKYPDNDYFQRILSNCLQYDKNSKSESYVVAFLSQREINVLSLAAEGLTRKEISRHLFISEETVKTHFKNIYEKLEVNSKMEAVKIAQARGYITSDLQHKTSSS